MVLRTLSLGLLLSSLVLAPSVRAQDTPLHGGQSNRAQPDVAASRSNSKSLFDEAAEHYQASNWRQAARCFAGFLADHPNDTQSNRARFYLGESLVQSQQYRPAISAFQQYLAAAGPHDDGRTRATLQLGVAAFAAKDWPVAEAALRRYLDQPPLSRGHAGGSDAALTLSAMRRLADICFESKKYTEAAELFANIAETTTDDDDKWEATYGQARSLELQPESEAAEQVYLQIADEAPAPHGDRALLALGLMDYSAGDFDDAEGVFRCLTDQFPDSRFLAEAHYWAGRACLQRGESAVASDTFKTAWSLIHASHSGQFRDALAYHRALAMFAQKEFKQADELLREMVTSAENRRNNIWQQRSQELLERIRKALAVRTNRRPTPQYASSRNGPRHFETKHRRGDAFDSDSEPEYVLSCDDRSIADELRQAGRLPEAIRCYLRVAALQPNSPEARSAMNSAAECYEQLAQHDDAAALRMRLKRLEQRATMAPTESHRVGRVPNSSSTY